MVKKTTTKKKLVKNPLKKKQKISIKDISSKIVKKQKTEPQNFPTKKKKRSEYIFTVGRRKSAIARVRYSINGNGEITVNDKDYKKYFPIFELQKKVIEPLELTNKIGTGNFSIKVLGGGTRGQAESIRLGISRILFKIDENLKPILKSKKLLTIDSRVKERKKYGLKKARRAPQWQKR